MEFNCQSSSLSQLGSLSKSDRHSILVEGCEGCGKSYLAHQYANMVNCQDFITVDPKVQELRNTIDNIYGLNNDICVCIENLDSGSLSASYSLLKFLEEPPSNVYLVVTCSNINNVPDTIISRSAVVTVARPTSYDLANYGRYRDSSKYSRLNSNSIWSIVRSFKDIDDMYSMSKDQIEYFSNFDRIESSKDSLSNIVWSLGHFPDNSETPVDLVIRYLICRTRNPYIIKICDECMYEIKLKRISTTAILSKLAIEFKYGG